MSKPLTSPNRTLERVLCDCGAPAAHQVQITVGVHGERLAGQQTRGTMLWMPLCPACHAEHVAFEAARQPPPPRPPRRPAPRPAVDFDPPRRVARGLAGVKV